MCYNSNDINTWPWNKRAFIKCKAGDTSLNNNMTMSHASYLSISFFQCINQALAKLSFYLTFLKGISLLIKMNFITEYFIFDFLNVQDYNHCQKFRTLPGRQRDDQNMNLWFKNMWAELVMAEKICSFFIAS